MTQFVATDAMTGSSLTVLQVHDAAWQRQSFYANNTALDGSGHARASDNAASSAYNRSETPGAADYYVEVDLADLGSTAFSEFALHLRYGVGTNSGYWLDISGGTVTIYRVASGVFTSLGAASRAFTSSYETVRFNITGNVLTASVGGSTVVSATDILNLYSTAGACGFFIYSDTAGTGHGFSFTNFKAVDSVGGGGPTNYTSTLTAGLTFAGATPKKTVKTPFTAAVSYAGGFLKRAGKALSAGASFAGSITRALSKGMTSALSFVATFIPQGSTYLIDAAAFDGSTYLSRGGNLTSLADSKQVTFSVWVHFDDASVRRALLSAAGVFSVTRENDNTILVTTSDGAALQTSASYGVSSVWHHLACSIDTSSSANSWLRVDGVLDVTKSGFGNTNISFSSAADWAVGALSSGARVFNGCMADLLFAPGKFLSDTAPNQELLRDNVTGKPVSLGTTGSLPFSATPALYLHLSDGEAASNFAQNRGNGGNLSATTGSLTTCATSPTDSILYLQVYTAAVSFAGAFVKTGKKACTGGLSFVTGIVRSVRKNMTASLQPRDLDNTALFNRAMFALLSFEGNLVKTPGKTFAGSASFTGGTIQRAVRHVMTAAVSFVGATPKALSRALPALLQFFGNFATTKGGGATQYSKPLTAAVSFSGTVVKSTGMPLSGAVSFVGSLTRRLSRTLTAAVAFVGGLTQGYLYARALTASLLFSGLTTKQTTKLLPSALSFVGVINRALRRAFSAVLRPTGVLSNNSSLPTPPTDPADSIYVAPFAVDQGITVAPITRG